MTKKSITTGYRVVVGVLTCVVGLQLLNAVLRLVEGQYGLGSIVRMVLTLWLCWSVYSGQAWARVVLGGLLTLGGALTAFGGLGLLALAPGFGVFFLLIGLLQLGCAVGLFAIPQVRDHFGYVAR